MSSKSCALFGTVAVAVMLSQQPAFGQQPPPPVDHSAHAAMPQGAADDCMTAQSKVSVTGTTARARLEEARQTNDPAKLRAAVDEALIAITSLLAATEPCRQTPAMGGMDHSKMVMPQPDASVSPRPAVAAPDPHAGHAMPPAPAAKPTPPMAKPTDPHAGMNMPAAPTKPGAKPAARPADPHAGMKMPAAPAKPGAKPAPKPADPHAGMKMPAAPAKPGAKPAAKPADPHAGMNMAPAGGAMAQDPKTLKCSPPVDPENAPTTTYKGKAYYFCTAAERLRFIMNPETYLKALKGPGK